MKVGDTLRTKIRHSISGEVDGVDTKVWIPAGSVVIILEISKWGEKRALVFNEQEGVIYLCHILRWRLAHSRAVLFEKTIPEFKEKRFTQLTH